MQPLNCRRCDNSVLVKKNSLAQTSVQWGTDSSGCPEFADRHARGDVPATVVIPTCPQLRASIEDAVRSGVLTVPEP